MGAGHRMPIAANLTSPLDKNVPNIGDFSNDVRQNPIYPQRMENLDDTDRRILRELQRDASLSLDQLSAAVNLSRNACWRRIKGYETAGLIDARVTLLNPDRLGLPLTVFIQIRTNAHEPGWLDRFKSATRAMPEIQGVYRMSGDLDYLIRARVRDMSDYDRLYQRLIARVPLSDVSASFVMEHIKDTTELPL